MQAGNADGPDVTLASGGCWSRQRPYGRSLPLTRPEGDARACRRRLFVLAGRAGYAQRNLNLFDLDSHRPPPGSRKLYGDQHVASDMVPEHVRDRARSLAQCVPLVDDHLDVARLEECGEGIEVLPVHRTCDELYPGSNPAPTCLPSPSSAGPRRIPRSSRYCSE